MTAPAEDSASGRTVVRLRRHSPYARCDTPVGRHCCHDRPTVAPAGCRTAHFACPKKRAPHANGLTPLERRLQSP